MDAGGTKENKQKMLWAFAGFCIFSAVVGVAGSAYATGWPSLLRLWVHDLVAYLVLTALALATKAPRPASSALRVIGWWLAVLFVAAPVFYAAVGANLGSSATTLVFGALPFLTVFMVAQREGGELALLAPAVVTLGGLALVVPFAWPQSGVGIGALGFMVVCAGIIAFAGIRLHALLQGVSILWAGALGSALACVLSFLAWLALQHGGVDWTWQAVCGEAAWGAFVDAPLVLLTVWLVQKLRPEGFSSRFALVPMLTVFAGVAVMHSVVAWTTWLGLLLVLGGSWILLRDERAETGDGA